MGLGVSGCTRAGPVPWGSQGLPKADKEQLRGAQPCRDSSGGSWVRAVCCSSVSQAWVLIPWLLVTRGGCSWGCRVPQWGKRHGEGTRGQLLLAAWLGAVDLGAGMGK